MIYDFFSSLRKNATIFPNSTGTGTSPKKVEKIIES